MIPFTGLNMSHVDYTEKWTVPTLREPRYSQSLERGLAILGCFTTERPIRGIADIAEELRMSRSTTHRYMITLVALGYLEQDHRRKYHLGLNITNLGLSALSSTSLSEHAQSHLEELRRRTRYTVNVAVLDGPEIVYIARAPSDRRGRSEVDPQPRTGRQVGLDLSIGSRLPAHCTAMGKLLMAHLPDREQRELIAEMKLERFTPNTITSRRSLQIELARIRADSFAVNDQELTAGLHSIAAPIRAESRDVVAAANMAAHSSVISLPELVDRLGPHLIATADRISARLGYRRDDELGVVAGP
jgi:IclR family transcriptional regulator, pca regulon regulatory protein